MSKEELEKRVINKEGKINLDASIKDFIEYVGYKSGGDKNGFRMPRTYYCLLDGPHNIKTLRELEKFREEGIGRSPLAEISQFGKKCSEDLNDVLTKFGIEPIPWITKKYKAWELRKKYEAKYGKEYWRYI
ncbi:hypothetical protein HYU07_06815 [Candidatus Woesearchaeota archaeon]|nr:hypothetical protein [Candidatus Woesearchaeota archaeon]